MSDNENLGGRPPVYDDPEELRKKIEEYFDKGVPTRMIPSKKGKEGEMVSIKVPTITGLVIYCGFCGRQSFYDYEKKKGFSYIIKRARARIENHYEELLQTHGGSGPIFALKNFGWVDTQKIDQTTTDISEKTREELERLRRGE